MVGVEIVSDMQNKTPDNETAEKIYYNCLENGLSFKISQGNILTLSPPMTINRDELDHALGKVEAAIDGVARP